MVHLHGTVVEYSISIGQVPRNWDDDMRTAGVEKAHLHARGNSLCAVFVMCNGLLSRLKSLGTCLMASRTLLWLSRWTHIGIS